MPSPTCPECGAAVAADQRYCLQCGARVAALRPVRVAARWAQAAPDDPPPRGPAHAQPPPRIAAALVLAVLGFGVLVGAAVSPDVEGTLAAGRPNLRIVLPPAPRPAPAPARPHRA
ncbi:MAG TPA: zinc-ribbon domain-containing protein, partial [Solirubrobacteraceae bacterium]